MTFDPTKPVRYRNGKPARILCVDRPHPYCPIVSMDDVGGLLHHYRDGRTLPEQDKQGTPWDLVNIPEEREVEFWVNVYRDRIASPCLSKNQADGYADTGRIACLHFKRKFTVGEGLS